MDTRIDVKHVSYSTTATDTIEYYCPECGRKYQQLSIEFWIQCDNCKEWYHGDCVAVEPYQADELDKFYCIRCERICGKSTKKPITNHHRHNRHETNPPPQVQSGSHIFVNNLLARFFKSAMEDVIEIKGHNLTVSFLLKKGFDRPILVKSKEGLDMAVPPSSFDVKDVMDLIGGDYELDVIDSRRQLSIKMPMVKFFRLMQTTNRPSVYNCISLEISRTKMSSLIKAPNIVNKLSWVENSWPDCPLRPSVGKYCLMSMKGSYTDFHIDFGGTTVWYHILKGEKIFYLIEPTQANLEKYEGWMIRRDQSEVFFPDFLDLETGVCKSLVLREGNTLFLPTGWIHAVLTTKDSIVFGGNFLHNFNIPLQMEIYEMENRIKTPDKFLFPFFELTNWYAAPAMVLKMFKDHFRQKPAPKYILEGLESLICFLKKWKIRSKEENSCKNGDYSPFAPKGGMNTDKIVKDLIKQLRRSRLKIKEISSDNSGNSVKPEKRLKGSEGSANEEPMNFVSIRSEANKIKSETVEVVMVDQMDEIERFFLCHGG